MFRGCGALWPAEMEGCGWNRPAVPALLGYFQVRLNLLQVEARVAGSQVVSICVALATRNGAV